MPKTSDTRRTTIGGQALIEGLMMHGPGVSVMAIRRPDGEIEVETTAQKKKGVLQRTPFVRGPISFVVQMTAGYKALMRSAEIAGLEDEESDFERRMRERHGEKFTNLLYGAVVLFSVALAVGLFMVLPTVIVGFFNIASPVLLALAEGVMKIAIFVLYLAAVSRMPDIKRVFEYHGAEHKTIACYEAGEGLTVENIKKYPRFHPRCGTSFILIILTVSVLVFSLALPTAGLSTPLRVVLKLALLPVVVGVSYEILRVVGRHDNALTRLISAPGLLLQNFTTYEPDDEQIAVAIEAMLPCIPADTAEDEW